MHSNVTITNVSCLHFSWATVFVQFEVPIFSLLITATQKTMQNVEIGVVWGLWFARLLEHITIQ